MGLWEVCFEKGDTDGGVDLCRGYDASGSCRCEADPLRLHLYKTNWSRVEYLTDLEGSLTYNLKGRRPFRYNIRHRVRFHQ